MLPLIEKAIFLADSISSRIKNKNEPIDLMIFYNNLLQDSKDELIRLIAAADNDTRAKTINILFTEVVRAVNNEMIINKHAVS